MKLSQKAEYALRAMLELARQYAKPHPLRSGDIAKNQQIPEKFLELILVELRRAGLLVSQRGSEGGHRLTRSPQEISVGEIWRVIDGEPFERTEKIGSDPFGFVFELADNAVSEVVDNVTLDDIRLRSESKQSVPDFNI